MVLGLNKPEHKKDVGKRLSEIAKDQGKDWIDTAIDLIIAEHQRISTIYFMMAQANGSSNPRPWIKFGTDASGHDPSKAKGLTHPRSYGTFPASSASTCTRSRYSLEDAIRK